MQGCMNGPVMAGPVMAVSFYRLGSEASSVRLAFIALDLL